MASVFFTKAKALFANAGVNWASADIRVALSTSYTPDVDAHQYLSSMTNECTGGNYVRKALANKAVTEDGTNHCAVLSADNVTWTALNCGTPAVIVVYLYNASDAAAPIIGVLDPTDTASNGGDWVAKWNNGASSGALFTI